MVTVVVSGEKQLQSIKNRSRSRLQRRRGDAAGPDSCRHQRRAPQGGRAARSSRCQV
jgi:hypothetical protein